DPPGSGNLPPRGMEPAVTPAVNPDARRIDAELPDQPAGTIHLVVKVGAPHVTVNRGTPGAAMPRAAAVVQIEHRIPAGREEMVEQVLARVIRPPFVHVLQVARAVDENHG